MTAWTEPPREVPLSVGSDVKEADIVAECAVAEAHCRVSSLSLVAQSVATSR